MRVPATLCVEGDLGPALELETENVCSKGTFLLTDGTVPKGVPNGVKVEVQLRITASEFARMLGANRCTKITVKGKVVRTDKRGIAVAFGRHYLIKAE
jgi:hypothetical protein